MYFSARIILYHFEHFGRSQVTLKIVFRNSLAVTGHKEVCWVVQVGSHIMVYAFTDVDNSNDSLRNVLVPLY